MTATREQVDAKLEILKTQFQTRVELINRLLAVAPVAIETLKRHLCCGNAEIEIRAATAIVSILGDEDDDLKDLAKKPSRSSRRTNCRAKNSASE